VLVDEWVDVAAASRPEKVALICGRERWSYSRLDRAVTDCANLLIEAEIQPGDRIAISLDNSPEAVVAMFGALRAGCVFVSVNPRASVQYLRAVLDDAGARVLITSPERCRLLAEAAPGRNRVTCIDGGAAARTRNGGRGLRLIRARRDVDLAALVYTSGSTGEPKGVMLTHHNLASAAGAICTYLELTEDDVILNALPLSFTYGLGQLTTAFRVGATVVLERSFAYPAILLETMARERVTGLPLVPTAATLLLRASPVSDRLAALRYITSAAAALPAATLRGLLEAFPRAQLFSMYGQTECQRASYLPPRAVGARPESVGVPIPGTSCTVVDEVGQPVTPGSVGELKVRGPHVMAGYWNRPEATRAVLRESPHGAWRELLTGDLFRTDAEGYLYFVERKDDIIKSGGEKIAPRSIEQVIATHPGVSEVTVLGVPDEVLGQAVAAVVTPRPGVILSAVDIRRHCLEHLDAWQVPKIVDVRATLPTTLNGKVSRRTLRVEAIANGWSA
jgi:long-chain acyl-CoA synthetase